MCTSPDTINLHYLESEQYKDASHLNDRIQLHSRFSTNAYGWFNWVFDQFDLPLEAKILEIGCGSGALWSTNAARLPNSWRMILSDFSLGMLKQARVNLISNKNSFQYEASNVMAIPFPSDTFDAVVANHMLYHVPDKQTAIAEISRVLKPDGTLFAATNGEDHLKELPQLMGKYIKRGDSFFSPHLSASSFTLENGFAQLSTWFEKIETRLYQDSLLITQPEPLIRYIFSMIPQAELQQNKNISSDVIAGVNQTMKQNGIISIQKSVGMFLCRK